MSRGVLESHWTGYEHLDNNRKATGLNSQHRSLLTDYMREVEPTDRLPPDDLQPVLLGLFGEVGSIMATAKKFHRERGKRTSKPS